MLAFEEDTSETLDEMDEMSLQERRRSDEIIAELKSCGIIITEKAKGGLSFDIMPCGNLPKRPGRLPALQRGNDVEPTEATALKNKERIKNAAIRRQEALNKKAKVGKEYDSKRMAVLERRANKIKVKIRRTKEKLNKGRRESTKNNRKISPETLDEMDEMSLQERRHSDEIIAELKSCGIITTEKAKGGLSFDIMPCGNLPRRHGRLPALRRSNDLEPTEATALKNKERIKNATIRRQEALDKKAKVGKEYDSKRMTVLERRANKIKDIIRRTKEKLNKDRRESTN